MKKLLTALFFLLILFVTNACVLDSTAPGVVSDYCRIAQPISYDTIKDTQQTIAEIEAHNSRFICVCEHDCPNGVNSGKN